MLCIQDPNFTDSQLLHEALLQASIGAECGAGVYAFVSSDGVQLLLEDGTFIKFLKRGRYQLIIGMDDITNTRTLAALRAVKSKHKSHVEFKAFLHDTKGSLFHPKLSWFKRSSGGRLVVGSGNLTQKGLRQNVEAFIVQDVDNVAINEIILQWNNWLRDNQRHLLEIDDPLVQRKALANEAKWKSKTTGIIKAGITRQTQQVMEASLIVDEPGAWDIHEDAPVLLAEIPGKTNDRWGQANFDKETYRQFFGAHPGSKALYEIILRSVDRDGSFGNIERRPAVSVKSDNHRFELGQAKRYNGYPANGKPIGIFVLVAPRTYLYSIVIPDHPEYTAIYDEIAPYRVRKDRLIRHITTVPKLKSICPTLPLLGYLA